mgnify:CR=1 FL=1
MNVKFALLVYPKFYSFRVCSAWNTMIPSLCSITWTGGRNIYDNFTVIRTHWFHRMKQRFQIMKKYILFAILLLVTAPHELLAQGLNLPAKHWGLSVGNSVRFTGIRINAIEKDIQTINGVNLSVWPIRSTERQTGTFNGLGVGLPLAAGTANRNGFSVGLLGVGAANNLKGINLGVLGVIAGNRASGINIGGLGVGSGNHLTGLNIGGLGVGSGGDVAGINIGGLGVGSGQDVKGFSVALLGVGAGRDMVGINLGGLGVGSGNNMTGFNFGGLGVGAGARLSGVNLSVLAVGSGKSLIGLSVAGLATGSPDIKGMQISLVSGGNRVAGITIAPAYFTVRMEGNQSYMKGLSISAFNHIQGQQHGVAIGVLNLAHEVKGFQLGLLNHVGNNPRGLRWLPIFNTTF